MRDVSLIYRDMSCERADGFRVKFTRRARRVVFGRAVTAHSMSQLKSVFSYRVKLADNKSNEDKKNKENPSYGVIKSFRNFSLLSLGVRDSHGSYSQAQASALISIPVPVPALSS